MTCMACRQKRPCSMLNSGDGKFIWPRSIFCMFSLVFKMTLVFNLNSIDLLISAQKLRLSVTQGMLHAYTNTPKWFWRNKIVTFIGNTLHTNNPVLYSEIFGYFRVTFFLHFVTFFLFPCLHLFFFHRYTFPFTLLTRTVYTFIPPCPYSVMFFPFNSYAHTGKDKKEPRPPASRMNTSWEEEFVPEITTRTQEQ